MKRSAAPISDVIKNVFARLEKEANSSKEEMDSCWKELVGEKGFRHSRPASLRKKILNVRVDSSGWMHELTMQKRQILKGLKRRLGKDRISELHFKIGELDG